MAKRVGAKDTQTVAGCKETLPMRFTVLMVMNSEERGALIIRLGTKLLRKLIGRARL